MVVLKGVLRYEYVYKCFASGWLSDDEFNGVISEIIENVRKGIWEL